MHAPSSQMNSRSIFQEKKLGGYYPDQHPCVCTYRGFMTRVGAQSNQMYGIMDVWWGYIVLIQFFFLQQTCTCVCVYRHIRA